MYEPLINFPAPKVMAPWHDKNKIKRLQLEPLAKFYRYRGSEDLLPFLNASPQLITFLQDSHPYLLQHFGKETTYVLELISEPEKSNLQQLLVYIRTLMPTDQALSQLDQFDEEWFLEQLHRVGDLINFNLEVIV